jgi:hypothetical protein
MTLKKPKKRGRKKLTAEGPMLGRNEQSLARTEIVFPTNAQSKSDLERGFPNYYKRPSFSSSLVGLRNMIRAAS